MEQCEIDNLLRKCAESMARSKAIEEQTLLVLKDLQVLLEKLIRK